MPDPIYNDEFFLSPSDLRGMTREDWIEREKKRRAASQSTQLSYVARYNDPRFALFFTENSEQQLRSGMFFDPNFEFSKTNLRNMARDISFGHRDDQRHRAFAYSLDPESPLAFINPVTNYAKDVVRNLGSMATLGTITPKENLSLLEGFMQPEDEWRHSKNFALSNSLRFSKQPNYDGMQNATLEYLIDPIFFKEVEGKRGRYLTQQSVPFDKQREFEENVETPAEALQFFEQLTGEMIYKELEILHSTETVDGLILPPSKQTYRNLLRDMSTPDMLAEDLLMFGFINIGGRAIQIGKTAWKTRKTTHAISNTTGRLVFGDDAVRLMDEGLAAPVTNKFGLMNAARKTGGVERVGKTTAFVAGVGFGATELARQEIILQKRNLTQQQETLTSGILFAAAMGTVGGISFRNQVNSGIGIEDMRTLFSAEEQAIEAARREIAQAKGVSEFALDENDLQLAVDKGMKVALQTADELGLENVETEILPQLILLAERVKSRNPLANFVQSPDMLVTDQAQDLPVLNNFVGKITDDMGRPEAQRADTFITEVIQREKEVRLQGQTAVRVLDELEVTEAAPVLDLEGKVVEFDDVQRKVAVGEVVGQLVLRPDVEGVTDDVIKDALNRANLKVDESQFGIIRESMSHLREALRAHVENMVNAGYLNRGLTEIDPFHFSRVWDTTVPLSDKRRKGLETLFDHWVRRHKYAHFIQKMKESVPKGVTERDWLESLEGIEDNLNNMRYEDAYQILRQKNLDRYFDKQVEDDVDKALSAIEGSIGSNERGISDFGAKAYRAKSLGIPNDYEVDGYRVYDYLQTHPDQIVNQMLSSSLKPVLTAARNINKRVPEMRARAAELLNEGNLTEAHNHNLAAQLMEIFDLLEDPASSSRIPDILQSISVHEQGHREALRIVDLSRPSGDPVRASEERYSLAEAIVLDTLLELHNTPDSYVARISDLKVEEQIARNQEIFGKHTKDYSDFRSKDFKKDEGTDRELLRGSPVARALGVDDIVDEGPPSDDLLPEEFRFLIEEPDEYDFVSANREPISKDALILLEANPQSRATTPLGKATADEDDVFIFDAVEGEKFGDSQREGVTTGRRPTEMGPVAPESPMRVNDPEVLKARKKGRRVGNQDGRVAWDKDQLLALREAAHTLFFSLSKEDRDEIFRNFLPRSIKEVGLEFSSTTKHSPEKALNRSEVFMEAVVESLATGGRLDNFEQFFTRISDDFSEVVTDTKSFKKFKKLVNGYAEGFKPKNKKTRDFLGNRTPTDVDSPGVLAARATLEENKIKQDSLRVSIRNELKDRFGRYEEGEIGRTGERVQPMVEDGGFVHGKPGQNIKEMVQAVAKAIELPSRGIPRDAVFARITRALSEFTEEGDEITRAYDEYYRQLDDSRRAYEASLDQFEILRDVAHKGLRKLYHPKYRRFYRNLRKENIGEGATDTSSAYLDDADATLIVPRIRSSFDNQLSPLDKKSLKEEIIQDGVATARRAETYFSDKLKAWMEYVNKYPGDTKGLENMAEQLDDLINAVQGRSPSLRTGDWPRVLGDFVENMKSASAFGRTLLYAKYASVMAITQILDTVNAIWALGIIPYLQEMVPALAKEFLQLDLFTKAGRIRRRLADSKKVPFIEDYLLKKDGTFGKSFENIFDELTVDEKMDFFLDTFARSSLNALEIVANPKLQRAYKNNPRIVKLNGVDGVEGDNRLLFEMQRALHHHAQLNGDIATAFISIFPSRVLRASHKAAKNIMKKNLLKAAKQISTVEYLDIMRMNLDPKDFGTLLDPKIKTTDDMLAAVVEGRLSQEAFDKIDNYGADRFMEQIKKKRSKELDRLRMIGFRDLEIRRLARAIDEAGGDVDKIPEDLLALFNKGRMKFSNNMNPVPTDASLPYILKNEIGNAFLVFLRFLTTASSKFARLAARRGGNYSVMMSQVMAMTMMATVEEIKLTLKGDQDKSGLRTFYKIARATDRGEMPELDERERSYLLKVINGSGQFGPLPEMIAGSLSSTRYGNQSPIPVFEFMNNWKNTGDFDFTPEGVGNMLDALGFGILDTALKQTKGLRE